MEYVQMKSTPMLITTFVARVMCVLALLESIFDELNYKNAEGIPA